MTRRAAVEGPKCSGILVDSTDGSDVMRAARRCPRSTRANAPNSLTQVRSYLTILLPSDRLILLPDRRRGPRRRMDRISLRGRDSGFSIGGTGAGRSGPRRHGAQPGEHLAQQLPAGAAGGSGRGHGVGSPARAPAAVGVVTGRRRRALGVGAGVNRAGVGRRAVQGERELVGGDGAATAGAGGGGDVLGVHPNPPITLSSVR